MLLLFTTLEQLAHKIKQIIDRATFYRSFDPLPIITTSYISFFIPFFSPYKHIYISPSSPFETFLPITPSPLLV